MGEMVRRFGPVRLVIAGCTPLLDAVERAFISEPGDFDARADLRLTARQIADPATDPCQTDEATALFFHDRTRVRHRDGVLWVWDGASVARIDPGETEIVLQWHQDSLVTDEFSRTFLYVLVALMLRTHGVFYVHGALVGEGDATALVLGESGAGKSTTVLTCIHAGWRWWTDDAVLLWLDPDGTPTLAGVARPFHLTAKTLDVFPELSGSVSGEAAGTGKYITHVHRWFAPEPEPVRVSRVVLLLPERAAETACQPLSQASVFAALGRACAWFGIPELHRATTQTEAVMRAASCAEGVAVALGRDSLREINVLAHALLPVRPAPGRD